MHLARTSLAALLTAGLLAPSAAAQAAPFPFHDGFESGSLAPHWTVTKHWGDGSAQVTTANGPHTGAYHLNLQGPPAAIDSNVTVDLAIDLTGESGVRLGFLVRDYGDEYSTSTSSWLGAGSHYYDGVFASGDGGVTWHEVLPLNDLTATGVVPGSTVHFVLGTQEGTGPCPPALGGLCVGVDGLVRYLGPATADAGGEAVFTLTVPAGASGRSLLLRAIGDTGSGYVLSDIVFEDVP